MQANDSGAATPHHGPSTSWTEYLSIRQAGDPNPVYVPLRKTLSGEVSERRCVYCSVRTEPGEPCGSCGRDPETGDPWPLRNVRLETGHTLRTWDTGRTDASGRTRIGYVLSDPDGAPIFRGTNFRCSPLHTIDSDESLRALLGFLTLRPGDTDVDYFADYTEAQRAFCESSECETLAFLYSEEGPGTFTGAEGRADA